MVNLQEIEKSMPRSKGGGIYGGIHRPVSFPVGFYSKIESISANWGRKEP